MRRWSVIWLVAAIAATIGSLYNPCQAAAALICALMYALTRRESRDTGALP